MDPWKKINKILEWQKCEWVHPLTCGNDECRTNLIPSMLTNMEVVLTCPNCCYQQDWVPDGVLYSDVATVDPLGEFK